MTDQIPEFLQTPLEFPNSIDSTMLSAFDACPMKFFIEFVLKRVPNGRNIHLHAGGCAASAFEIVRKEFYANGKTVDEALQTAFRKFVVEWGDFPTPENTYKDFINTWGAVVAYFQEYHPASDYFQPFIKADGEPAVEFRFAVPTQHSNPHTGDPILFAGRADVLAQNDPNSCYVLDEKTTNALGSSWYYQWDMRGQFYGYAMAARLMGYPCVGAVVRGIAIKQTGYDFAEKVLFYNQEQLERWWYHANQKIERMVLMFEEAEFLRQQAVNGTDDPSLLLRRMFDTFSMSFGDACGSYGGCQFTDVCLKNDPWHLLSEFERRVWDPLAQDPSAKSESRLLDMEEIPFAEFAQL